MFKFQEIWYKYLYSDDIENIDLVLIDRIRIHNDCIIDSENIRQIFALDFPELLFLKIGHRGGIWTSILKTIDFLDKY